MGKRGPRPKPTQIKILNGSFQKHPERFNADEPTPPEGCPVKPDHLDGIASQKWDDLSGILDQMGLLAVSDGDIMELYCVTYSAYRKALADVARTGQVLVTRKQDGETVEVKRNPFSVELHKYRDALLKMQPELGLTAASRSQMVAPQIKRDALAEIQAAVS